MDFGNEADQRAKEAEICVQELEDEVRELRDELGLYKYKMEMHSFSRHSLKSSPTQDCLPRMFLGIVPRKTSVLCLRSTALSWTLRFFIFFCFEEGFLFFIFLVLIICYFISWVLIVFVCFFLWWCKLAMYDKTRNRGLAFVTMGSPEEARSALDNLESSEMEGHVIQMAYARPKKTKIPSPSSQPKPMTFNLYVENFPYKARSKDLKELFMSEDYNVVTAEIVFQNNPRRSAGYGFVVFKTKAEAEAALSASHGKEHLCMLTRTFPAYMVRFSPIVWEGRGRYIQWIPSLWYLYKLLEGSKLVMYIGYKFG